MGQSIFRDTADLLAETGSAAFRFAVSATGVISAAALFLLPFLPTGLGPLALLGPVAAPATLALTLVLSRVLASRHHLAPSAPAADTRHLFGGQAWRDLVFCLTGFVISAGGAFTVVLWWTLALGGLAYPLYSWALPYSVWPVACVLAGLVFAVTLPTVVSWCVTASATHAHLLLGPRPDLRSTGSASQRTPLMGSTASAPSTESTAAAT
jgi:hypothetical protein